MIPVALVCTIAPVESNIIIGYIRPRCMRDTDHIRYSATKVYRNPINSCSHSCSENMKLLVMTKAASRTGLTQN